MLVLQSSTELLLPSLFLQLELCIEITVRNECWIQNVIACFGFTLMKLTLLWAC
jgi:hypothetical protein